MTESVNLALAYSSAPHFISLCNAMKGQLLFPYRSLWLIAIVRLITVTDYHFGKMEVFYGRKPRGPEEARRTPRFMAMSSGQAVNKPAQALE